MLERLEHAFLRGRRSNKASAVFFLDLDRFKQVNDRCGHQAGDQLLVAVGKRLIAVLRPGDTLARLHGDEFVILCEDLDDAAQIDVIAARIAAAMIAPFQLTGFEVQISASIGIALTGHENAAAEQLLEKADRAMYRSKRAERRDNAVP